MERSKFTDKFDFLLLDSIDMISKYECSEQANIGEFCDTKSMWTVTEHFIPFMLEKYCILPFYFTWQVECFPCGCLNAQSFAKLFVYAKQKRKKKEMVWRCGESIFLGKQKEVIKKKELARLWNRTNTYVSADSREKFRTLCSELIVKFITDNYK